MKTPAAASRFSLETLPESSGARDWWPLALTLGVFLLARPYEGLVHDARLYVGFAIAPLDPNGIGSDLLFREDGQSGRSLYPPALRALSVLVGPSRAAFLATLIGLCIWFVGLWRLLRQLWPGLTTAAIGGTILVATGIQTYYGGASTFHVAEAFASPRNAAEGLVLLALSFALRGISWQSVVLVLVAMSLHPIMAVSGAALIAWLALPQARLRWWAVAVAATACVALVAASAAGVGGIPILRVFDAEWLRVLDGLGALVFLRNWTGVDWARIVVHLVTIAMAAELLDHQTRRLLVGATIIASAGILLSFVGGDVVHNVLITQAQPWRALWLLAVFGGVLLARLLHLILWAPNSDHGSRSAFRRVAAWLLLISWFMLATSDSAATLALLSILLWKIPDVRPSMVMTPTVPRVLALAVPVILVVMVWLEARVVFEVFAASPDRRQLWHLPTFVLAGILRPVSLAVAYWMWRSDDAPARLPSGLSFTVGTAVLASAAFLFDSRTAFEREVESALDQRIAEAVGKASVVPPRPLVTGPVVWPDGEVETWAFFGTSGYGNGVQGIPRVFSRELAIRWAARRKRILRLQTVARAPRYRLRLDRLYSDDPTGIRELCAQPDAPGTVVLTRRPVWAVSTREISLPSPQLLPGQDSGVPWDQTRTLYLVECSAAVRRYTR